MKTYVAHMPTLLEPLKDLKKNITQRSNKHLAWPNKKLECNHILTLSHWKITKVFNPKKKYYTKKYIKILKKCKIERTDGLIL
jgi:hypothetical protein